MHKEEFLQNICEHIKLIVRNAIDVVHFRFPTRLTSGREGVLSS